MENSSRRTSAPSNRLNIQSAARQLLRKKKEEEKKERDRERAALSATTEALKQVKASFENEKKEKAELEHKLHDLQQKYNTSTEEVKKSQHALDKQREDTKRKLEHYNKMEREHVTMEDRIRMLEAKASETEKMELMVESTRRSLESSQVECRDKERQLRYTKSELEETKTQLALMVKNMSAVDDKVRDLKMQVQEELIRNEKMEKNLSGFQHLELEMKQKDEALTHMKSSLHDKMLLLEHARTSAREARDKCKSVEQGIVDLETMKEELNICRSETITLKQLILGKDTLIVQQAQALHIAKKLLTELDPRGESVESLQRLLEQIHIHKTKSNRISSHFTSNNDQFKPATSSVVNGHPKATDHIDAATPHTDHERSTDHEPQCKQNQQQALINGNDYSQFVNTRRNNGQINGSSNRNTPRYSLNQDQNKRLCSTPLSNVKHKRIKSAVVKPTVRSDGEQKQLDIHKTPYHMTNNNQSLALTSSTTSLSQSRTSFLETLLQSDGDQKLNKPSSNSCNSSIASNTNSSIHHETFTNFRTEPVKSNGYRTPRLCNGHLDYDSGLDTYRPMSSSGRLNSSRSLTQQDWDRLAAHCIRVGDRVQVKLPSCKKKDKLHGGVVRFIGQVDMEYPDLRLHVGLKMDEPVGNTDGLYLSKRYFTVQKKHGRFVKISDVVSVLNSKISSYQKVADTIDQMVKRSQNGYRIYFTPR